MLQKFCTLIITLCFVTPEAFASFSYKYCSNATSSIKYTFYRGLRPPNLNEWRVDGKIVNPIPESGVVFNKEIILESKETPMVSSRLNVYQLHLMGINSENANVDVTDYVICKSAAGI